MYLAQNNLPEAIKYFNESLSLYPKGRFVGISVVSKAAAEARTGKYTEAATTFKDYLSKNPPPEVGVIALSGLAGVYKDTQKWDDAIKTYQDVRSKYPNTRRLTKPLTGSPSAPSKKVTTPEPSRSSTST